MATIRKRGDTWQAIVRITTQGQLHEESKTFTSERLARDWATKLEQRIRTQGVPQRVLSTTTVGELIEQYEATRHAIQPLTRNASHNYSSMANAFRTVKLSEMTAQTFVQFAIKKKASNGSSPATIAHDLATVRAALNAAKPVFGIAVDGATVTEALAYLKRIGLAAKSQEYARSPTTSELDRIKEFFHQRASHHETTIPMATIIDLALALPRRLGELTQMQWVDYKRDAGTLLLRDTKHPVAPRQELIPVPPSAARIISSLPVFDARILPHDSRSVSAAFQRACKHLEIYGLRFHDLRHEGITRLFAQGLGVQEVAVISGHKSWTMLRRYTHIKPSDILSKLK